MLAEPVNIKGPTPVQSNVSRGSPTGKGRVQGGREAVSAPDSSEVRASAVDVEKKLDMTHDVDLKFTVHKASDTIMVSVKDGNTGKVIREIPPSEILNLAARLDKMAGLIFDKKA